MHTIGECAYYPPDNRFVGLVNRTTTVINELTDNDSDDSFEEVEHEYQGHGIVGLAHQFEAYFKGSFSTNFNLVKSLNFSFILSQTFFHNSLEIVKLVLRNTLLKFYMLYTNLCT